MVTPENLRFDFSHFQKVSDEEIREIEKLVNEKVRRNESLEEFRNMPIAEARTLGAMALFGEKYGDEVRVIKYGSSVELCGGTHVASTGNIGMVKIMAESSTAAGIRRIEAITANKVEELLYTQQDLLKDIKSLFNNVPNLSQAIRKAIDENVDLKKQVEESFRERMISLKNKLIKTIEHHNGVNVIQVNTVMVPEMVKDIAFQLRGQITEHLLFVAGTTDTADKPLLTVMLSDDMVAAGVNASAIVRQAAKLIEGGGGGQPHFAQAGGKNSEGLPAAICKIIELATK